MAIAFSLLSVIFREQKMRVKLREKLLELRVFRLGQGLGKRGKSRFRVLHKALISNKKS